MADISDIKKIIEDLLTPIIEKTVRQIIKEELKLVLHPVEANDILSFDQVQDFLQISRPKLYAMTSKKLIPYYKRGNKLYFSKQRLVEWIQEGKVKTNKEINEEADKYVSRNRLIQLKKPIKPMKDNNKKHIYKY